MFVYYYHYLFLFVEILFLICYNCPMEISVNFAVIGWATPGKKVMG
jgi:hypothetical protein